MSNHLAWQRLIRVVWTFTGQRWEAHGRQPYGSPPPLPLPPEPDPTVEPPPPASGGFGVTPFGTGPFGQ